MPGQNLVPEKRTDSRGVAVTRWVRPSRGAKPSRGIPAPSAKPPREAFVPGPNETGRTTHIFEVGEGSHHRALVAPPSPELRAIPRPPNPTLERVPNSYLFEASYAEFYDVLSAVPPQDALDLLQRGIRSADEARAFLSEHGLADLGWEASVLTNEFMRNHLPPNKVLADMGAVVDADPEAAVQYVLALGEDRAAERIRDHILDGRVAAADLREVGLSSAAVVGLREVAEAIVRSKADGGKEFTLANIGALVRGYARAASDGDYYGTSEGSHIEVALSVLRFHGMKAADEVADWEVYARARSFLGDQITDEEERRLAGLAVFASEIRDMVSGDDDADAVIAAFDAGVSIEAVNERLDHDDDGLPLARKLDALTEGLHSPTADGWL